MCHLSLLQSKKLMRKVFRKFMFFNCMLELWTWLRIMISLMDCWETEEDKGGSWKSKKMEKTVHQSNISIFHKSLDPLIKSILNNYNISLPYLKQILPKFFNFGTLLYFLPLRKNECIYDTFFLYSIVFPICLSPMSCGLFIICPKHFASSTSF